MPEVIAPDQSKENSFARDPLLRGLLQVVGIIGTGGGGFAALSFGIGYMATKSHDAMLGIPTTATTYGSYVRTGALFFPNSIHYFFQSLSWYLVCLAIIGGIALVVFSIVPPRWKRNLGNKTKAISLAVIYTGTIVLAVSSTQWQNATFHPGLKGLLLQDDKPIFGDATESADIYGWLRQKAGSKDLQHRFGLQLGALLAFAYAAFLLRQWRLNAFKAAIEGSGDDGKEISGETEINGWHVAGRPLYLLVIDWLLAPLLYGTILTQAILLPANYGVLGLSNEYYCVKLSMKEDPRVKAGYLLSDLSAEPSQIILLHRQGEYGYTHGIYERKLILEIEKMECGPLNILYTEGSDKKSEQEIIP